MNPITGIRPIGAEGFVSAIDALRPIGIGAVRAINTNEQAQEAQEAGAPTFADLLRSLVDNANVTDTQSRANITNLSWGFADTALHNIEIDALRADLALRTLTSVRNNVLEAYQEIMRITI